MTYVILDILLESDEKVKNSDLMGIEYHGEWMPARVNLDNILFYSHQAHLGEDCIDVHYQDTSITVRITLDEFDKIMGYNHKILDKNEILNLNIK